MTEYLAARRSMEDAALAVAAHIATVSNEVIGLKAERSYHVVTKADLDAEQIIREKLTAFDPSISIRGEEFGGDRQAPTQWLIDPIDGSGHFSRKMPWATTMIALIVDDEIVASVINNFATGELYSASAGGGATKNREPIHMVDRKVPGIYMLYDFDIADAHNLQLLQTLEARFPMLNYWSCGHSYASVAQGSFDGRICRRKGEDESDWDHVPGALLVKEAGGIVANFASDAYDYPNHDFIAASPSLFRFLNEDPEISPLLNAR